MAHPMQHYGERKQEVKKTRLFDQAVRSVEDFLEEAFPCICSVHYSDRGLEDPRCYYHVLQELAPDITSAVLRIYDE